MFTDRSFSSEATITVMIITTTGKARWKRDYFLQKLMAHNKKESMICLENESTNKNETDTH